MAPEVLYTLYTNDCRSQNECTKLIKFADDTVILGLIRDSEEGYINEVQNFADWCKDNHLILNVKKTKEMIIDFRIKKNAEIQPLNINHEVVEIVNRYKYLGFIIDDKLSWHNHIQTVNTKLHQRLFFLRKLKSFSISQDILKLFYFALVQNVISFGIACWGGNVSMGDQKKIDKVIKRAEKIIDTELPHVSELYERFADKILENIIKDTNHPLSHEFPSSKRSGRYLCLKTRTERYRKSFIPAMAHKMSVSKILHHEVKD